MLLPTPKTAGPATTRTRATYGLAALVFALATWYALAGVDIDPSDLSWGALLLLVGVGVPLLAVLNGEEFRAMARLLGHRTPFVEGLQVSVLGSAANILPVPGAALVRMAALRRRGAGYGAATTVILLAAVAWGAATLLVAGSLLAGAGDTALGLTGVAVGAVAAAGVAWVARRRYGTPLRAVGRLLVVEVASVLVGAVRFLLVLVAVGEEVDLAQAAALTVAGVVAAATGVFPGGLGLREALAGLIGPVVDLPSQLAVLAAVGNRIAEYLVLGPVALWFARGHRTLPLLEAAREATREQPDGDLDEPTPPHDRVP